ncbi:MAG: TolB family protein [Solirubrobacterales bacterium]
MGASFAALVLAGLALAGSAHAAFPGSNGRIAFGSTASGPGDPSSGDSEIWTANPQVFDHDLRTLTRNARQDSAPAYSPNGKRIAWDRAQAIWVMNADGSSKKRLTPTGTNNIFEQPTWSPDGKRIAYIRNDAIWTMNADGTQHKLLKDVSNTLARPTWSPNGNRIAYSEGVAPNDHDIVSVRSGNGGDRQGLATGLADELYPDYSPVGSKILYQANGDIWMMDAGGGDQELVQSLCNENLDPAWSPSGTSLAWVCVTPNVVDVYEAKLSNLGNPQAVSTTGTGPGAPIDGEPSWQPR